MFGFTPKVWTQQAHITPERGSIQPGFIITLKGDTIKGYLLNINLWLNQHMTFYYKDTTDFKGRIKYKPKELRAYQVGSRYYQSMKFPFTYSLHAQNFILRKLTGPIDYYVWYFDQDRAKLSSPDISIDQLSRAFLFDEKELWKDEFTVKNNGEFTKVSDFRFLMKFAKNMSEYVKDDAELAAKIQNKTKGYQGIDIEKIIQEYNERKVK